MRTSSSLLALLALVACSSEQPRAHRGAVPLPAAQALGIGDPHAVIREETPSSYCLACHPGLDLNGHPLGVSLLDAATRNPDMYVFPPTNPLVVVVNGATVQCTSCHDDGTAGFPFKTVAADMCTPCHEKGGAPPQGDVTPPAVTVTVAGGPAPIRGQAPVQATVSDAVGVVRTEVRVGVTPATADTLVPSSGPTETGAVTASIDSTALPDGTSWVVVRAWDLAGNVGTAFAPLDVDNTAPTIAITTPADGATLRWETTVAADAFDARGVASVSLYAGRTLLGAFTAPPYAVAWVPVRRSGTEKESGSRLEFAGRSHFRKWNRVCPGPAPAGERAGRGGGISPLVGLKSWRLTRSFAGC